METKDYLLLYQDQEGNLYPYAGEETLPNVLLRVATDTVELSFNVLPFLFLSLDNIDAVYEQFAEDQIVLATHKEIIKELDNIVLKVTIINDLTYAVVGSGTLERLLADGWEEAVVERYGQCLVKEINNDL